MALIAHKQPATSLPPNVRRAWEQTAGGWLIDPMVRSVVSVYANDVVAGLFMRLGVGMNDTESLDTALALALVVDLHTIHQRQGVGRVLWQAMRPQLHQEGITRVYAAQENNMLENTFWPSLGAQLRGQWFELDI